MASSYALIAWVVHRQPKPVTELTVDTIAEMRSTTEAQEGMRAFLDKRPPRWVEDDRS